MNTTNPFDFSQIFAKFNPEEIAKQFQGTANVDFESIKEAQNKNMELLINTNKAIAEGSRSLMERQIAMMQEAMGEAVKATQDIQQSGSPEDISKKQVEMLQLAYETAIKNSKEISEMAKDLQDQVAEKVNTRVVESLKEIKDVLEKAK